MSYLDKRNWSNLTAEEGKLLETEAGIKSLLWKMAQDDPIANATFKLQRMENLSDQHTAWLMAFHAIRAYHSSQRERIEHLNVCPYHPPIIVEKGEPKPSL